MKKSNKQKLNFESFETSRINNSATIKGKGDGHGNGMTRPPRTGSGCVITR